MKKNLKIEEEWLTEEMIATFYPSPGKPPAQKPFTKEKSIGKLIVNKKRNNPGLKAMYSINN